MSHADDANRSTDLRGWLAASFVLVVPLMWVGIQARDLPLYMVGAARPAHVAMTAQAAGRHYAMTAGTHAPLLSGAHGNASAFVGKRTYAIAGAQAYPLAVAEPR